MALRFRFRWIPFIAALIAAAIGLSLGQWQTRRALEKESIEARLVEREAAPVFELGSNSLPVDELEFRRVALRGRFVPDWNVFLDNRPYKSAAGFYVLTPFKVDGGNAHVLVNRGWVPRNPVDRARLPPIPLPAGPLEIEGVVRRSPGQILQLGTPNPLQPGAIVQNVEIAEFERAAGIQLQPFVVEQVSASGDGLVRDWPRASSGADRHRGYAFQWYGLAATALIFFFVTGFTRGSRK